MMLNSTPLHTALNTEVEWGIDNSKKQFCHFSLKVGYSQKPKQFLISIILDAKDKKAFGNIQDFHHFFFCLTSVSKKVSFFEIDVTTVA